MMTDPDMNMYLNLIICVQNIAKSHKNTTKTVLFYFLVWIPHKNQVQ